MINESRQIKTDTDEGKLLMAAIAMITTKLHTNKTPDKVIELLNELSDKMFNEIDKGQNNE